MVTLKPGEICPKASTCKYNKQPDNFCWGAQPRDRYFKCDYIDDQGEMVKEDGHRSKWDLTGRMTIINE